ncbi:hypothetical protein BOH66_11295 [Microbacterium aurum]|uniref:Uncharacterized protein n=1 Tax=Microbacterium aurum TaxID=36805 RepID=A0A1P8U9E2_9MICO|nr:hypothetical protein BOH66_11295 [Microbacterium aurum]
MQLHQGILVLAPGEGVSDVGLAGWQLTAAGLVLLLPALLIDGVPHVPPRSSRWSPASSHPRERKTTSNHESRRMECEREDPRSAIDTEENHCPFARACPMTRAASGNAVGLGPEHLRRR